MDAIKIIFLCVVTFVLIYIVVKAILWYKAKRIMKRIGKKDIILIASNANFFGQESNGLNQIRENRILVLTRNKIYFELLLPKRIIEIPLEQIQEIEETRSHLGKINGSKLLKIVFKNKLDSMDSCAWLVRNRREWINKLVQLEHKEIY